MDSAADRFSGYQGLPVSGQNSDGRPPMVVAMYWVHQVTTISLMMAAPAGLGYWLDKRWGTQPWLVIVGAVLGFITAMTQLLQLANSGKRAGKKKSDS